MLVPACNRWVAKLCRNPPSNACRNRKARMLAACVALRVCPKRLEPRRVSTPQGCVFRHWPRQLVHPWHVNAEHLLVKKKQGTQGLSMGRNGHLALGCKISQKPLNLGLTHVAGMLEVIKMKEVFDPIDISRFGSEAIVQPSESAHATDRAAGLTDKPASWFFWGCYDCSFIQYID